MIRGVVSKVSSNPYQGKELWSFRLNGDNNYYNTGTDKPGVSVGQPIEFDTKIGATGKHSVLMYTIKPWEASGEVLQAATVGAVARSGGSTQTLSKDAYWASKEARDLVNDSKRELGATRNTAIAFVEMLVKTESLVLPKVVSKRADVLFAAVGHYTEVFMKGETAVKAEDAGEESVTADAEPDWK